MKKIKSRISVFVLVFPVIMVLAGITVIHHDCPRCNHNDIDFFSVDVCCSQVDHPASCCHADDNKSEKFHKCKHTVYSFYPVLHFNTAIFHLETVISNTVRYCVLNLNDCISEFAFTEKFRPPPKYLVNNVLRI